MSQNDNINQDNNMRAENKVSPDNNRNADNKHQPHICVLMGGWSPERDISLLSGQNCASALRDMGYRVSELDVKRDFAIALAELRPDLVYNALHGIGGEDGLVQGVLETLAIPYTHSGVLASALAMHKIKAKRIIAESGVPVADDVMLAQLPLSAHPLPRPYVIKPVGQGSSFGVQLVGEGDDVPYIPPPMDSRYHIDDMTAADRFLPSAVAPTLYMAETYIPGREMTCVVMGDKALEVMEILPRDGFFDFDAKYSGAAEHILPAKIPDSVRHDIQKFSLMTHQALGCRGVTRTDLRFDEQGAGVVVLEINTQPGMTNISLVPEIAAHHGISYQQVVRWIVEDASCQR